MESFDVAVVGAGVMGAATARALARSGRDVLVLEQFQIGHARGSSHGTSRIFRFSYPDPRYVRMAMESRELWAEAEDEVGEQLITPTGGLDAGKALDEHVAALSECGADYEIIDGAEVTRRWPAMSLDDDKVLYQPDAGICLADRAVESFVSSARFHGADVREGTRVTELRMDEERVELSTSIGSFEARTAVVTAGAWARPLLSGVGYELDVKVTRETVAHFPLEDAALVPSLVDWGDPSFYALTSPGVGVKAGEHHAGVLADPDEERRPDPVSLGRLDEAIRSRYPGARPEAELAETCLYTTTPDEGFVLERFGRVVVGSPCSGHGFKFAPWVGRELARLALQG